MDYDAVSAICKALGSPIRLKIVKQLTRGETCACELLKNLTISQPTLSHHMRILKACHLIVERRDWKWSYYTLDCTTLTAFRTYIAALDCKQSKGAIHG
ncbi:helix-turn-helix transcriptional regulator [uncultured Acidaminococcus sp.]|mgnify:CR=1 FL=1|jgi:ArsR family transcriptional regulator|uniref:ArsR/SmtB family transcription factor n=1 Tax=uncultured Acidaminococcus sp. TaxID=352152 RepID=UPI0025E7A500|nr:metalloregulator ArsR/SmtB family transcription factor [uncultured Acidaminococcus sp.]